MSPLEIPIAKYAKNFMKGHAFVDTKSNEPTLVNCSVLACRLPPAPVSPRTPVPASPVPLVVVRLGGDLLLIDDVACEDLLLVRVEGSLIAYIETGAHDRVCVDVAKTITLRLWNELVRRQCVQRSQSLGRVRRLHRKPGRG